MPDGMTAAPAAAPAAAPSAPSAPSGGSSAPTAAPSGPAVQPFGGESRGYGRSGPATPPVTPPVAQSAPAAAKPGETPVQRAARLERLRGADGQEHEVDVAEFIASHEAGLKRKVKVAGVEREATLAELEAAFPLAEGARTRFEEGAKAKKEAEQLRSDLRERIVEPLRNASKDPRSAAAAFDILSEVMGGREQAVAFMEQTLAPIYQREALPPKERQTLEQRERADAELRAREDAVRRAEQQVQGQTKQQQEAQMQQATAAARQKFERDVPVLIDQAIAEVGSGMAEMLADPEVGPELRRELIGAWAREKNDALELDMPHDDRALAVKVAKAYHSRLTKLAGPLATQRNREAIEQVAGAPGRGQPFRGNAPPPPKPPIRSYEELRDSLKATNKAAQAEYERTGRWQP